MPSADQKTIQRVHVILLAKLYNCRCNEHLKSITHTASFKQKKSADVHVGLRDKLKTYAAEKKVH